MSEAERPDEDAAADGSNLYTRAVDWFKEVCWEFDSQDRSIRSSEFHQRVLQSVGEHTDGCLQTSSGTHGRAFPATEDQRDFATCYPV